MAESRQSEMWRDLARELRRMAETAEEAGASFRRRAEVCDARAAVLENDGVVSHSEVETTNKVPENDEAS